MESGHNAQIVSGDGQHAQLLVLGKCVRINNCHPNISHIDGIKLIQAVESLRVHVFDGAIGDLDRGNILQAQLQEKLGAQQDWVFGTHISNHQIGDIRAELLRARVQSNK